MAQSNDGSQQAGAPEGAEPHADSSSAGDVSRQPGAAGASAAGQVPPEVPPEPAPPERVPPEPAPRKSPVSRTTVAHPSGRSAAARAAAAPKPSRSARHPAVTIMSGIFTFLLFLAVGGGLMAWSAERAFYAPGPLATEKVVNIPRGAGVRDMGDILEREGVIGNALFFVAGVAGQKLVASQKGTGEGDGPKLQAGEYVFKPAQSLAGVIDTITSGKVVVHQITIPEGLTSQQVVKRLMDNELLTGTPAVPVEGSLLPETYRITRGQSRDEVLKQMAEAQRKVVAAIWAKRASDVPLRSPQELVTLASIVEKETGKDEERQRVAAVFVNRLGKKMRLQSDPTIIYGIVGGRGSLGRPISRTDISTPTAYNTYAIDGLPPGPICNPGREALAAAANPARTRDLFFVADGTGGHAFAETLNDHNKNVARWRAIEQGAATPPAPGQPAAPAPAAGN